VTVTSANPDDLDRFVTAAGRSRRGLEPRFESLIALNNAVVAGCADFAVASGALANGGNVFVAMDRNERFVDKVSDTLRRADRDPSTGVATVSSAQVATALQAAGLAQKPGPVTVEPGVLLGIPPTSGFVDDPICAANGNFVEIDRDLVFPGRTAVLDLVRVYNSLASTKIGAFGPGWSSTLDLRIAHVPGGVLRAHLADGAVVPFSPVPSGEAGETLRAAGNRHLEIETLADGWLLREGHTKVWRFSADGTFVGGSAEGAALEVERDGERVVALHETVSGRSIRFTWGGGRVVAAETSDGRVARYSYDDGVLVGVDRPTGPIRFRVDGTLVTAVSDADGVVLARNVYDEAGKVVEQTNELDRTTRYLYTEFGTTVISDTTGGPRNAFTHDDRGNVTAVVDGTGRAMRLAYDDAGRVTRVTGRDGAVRTYAYDDAGNLVERVDPDGLATRWTWDDRGRLLTETHRTGAVTTYEYQGEHRRPTRIGEPGGATIEVTLDDLGQPVRTVDADGVTSTFEWDADGQVTAVVDGVGNRTTFGYDAAGLLASVTDGSGVVTELRADAAGRVVEALVSGAVSRYAYSPAGRPLSGEDQAGVAWSASYGSHGRAQTFTDGAGSTVGFEWDVLGNLRTVVAPDGERYGQDFDEAGRLVAVRDPEGRATRHECDAEGRVLAVVDAEGRTWRREVDALGRTTRVVLPDGSATSYEYHANGIVAKVVRGDTVAASSELDAAGRIRAITDAAGGRWELVHSPGGRLLERRSPTGRVERWEYDAAGRVVAAGPAGREVRIELDGRGRTTRLHDGIRDVRWRYDDAGDVVAVEGGLGDATIERDAAGRIVAITDGEGVRRTYRWDERGLLAEATEAAGIASTFERDGRGRLASVTNARGETTAYGYDRTGYLQTLTDPTGTLARTLDPAGHVLAQRHQDGSVIERRLDVNGRPTGFGPAGADPVATFAYGSDGHLVEAVRVVDEVRTTFDWDGNGRLREVRGPVGFATIDRDEDGAIRSWRIPAGEIRVRRDLAGRLVGLDDPDAGVVDLPRRKPRRRDRAGRVVGSERGAVYRYDDAGRLVEALDEQGRRWAFEYGSDGLLAAEDSPLDRRRYHRGFLGRLERIEHGDGTETVIDYDGAGRRVAATRTDGSSQRWVWDSVGLLVAVERTSPDGAAERLDLALDAWGRPFRVGDLDVEWDDASSGRPSRIGTTRYLHLAGRAMVAQAGAPWREAPSDPWGSSDDTTPGLGFCDELSAWGLVWMGARVYDTATREFLSPDPLPAVAGKPGSASLYAYGFLDPVNHLDPSGQRPVSQQEFDAIREREEQGRFGQAWEAMKDDPWGTLGMVAVVAAGTALLFTPAAAIGAGILIGAAASAAGGVVTGTFDPRMVAAGGVVGAIPGGNSLRGAVAFGAGSSAALEGYSQIRSGDLDLSNLVVNTAIGAGAGGATRGVQVRINGARSAIDAPAAPTTGGARFIVDPGGVVTDLGPQNIPGPRVVIGESMNRVRGAADEIGADVYRPPHFDNDTVSMAHNRYWINEQMNQGNTIVDIGPAPGRANYPEPTSPWYQMERDELQRRDHRYYEQMEWDG